MAWTDKQVVLRPYQKQDVKTLRRKKKMLLAADTGTGKTITYLRATELVTKYDESVQKAVIFCPPQTKRQVAKEIKKHTDSNVLIIGGPSHLRKQQFKRARNPRYKYIIMATSIILDRELKNIQKLLQYCVEKGELIGILDEAYILKNGPAAETAAKRVKALFAIKNYFAYRWAVTGTPVQNTPTDMYWIMNWLYGTKVLGTQEEFDANYVIRDFYGAPRSFKNLDTPGGLYEKIAPYIIRHSENDPDVSPYLPKMTIENVYAEIEDANTKRAYFLIREAILEGLAKLARFPAENKLSDEQKAQKWMLLRAVQARYMNLRILCVGGTELLKRRAQWAISQDEYVKVKSKKTGRIKEKLKKKKSFSRTFFEKYPELFEKTTRGPKIAQIGEFVNDILRENENFKFVIFCYFRDAIDMIHESMEKAAKGKYQIVVTKGGDESETKKVSFNEPTSDVRVLLTTDSNLVGVDLPGGSHLIHMDVPFNYALWHQRSTRIRRTGSLHKRVHIFNFLLENTTEERQWEHIERTQEMSASIVDGSRHRREKVETASGRMVRGLKLNENTLSAFLSENPVGKDDE